jgi:arylsulfatase A-like enzyme
MMGLINDSYPLPEPIHDNWDHLSPGEKDIEDQKISVYAAMIDRIDKNIGRLIEHLSESGELDNTLILFASDNGSSAAVVELGDGEIGGMIRWASLGPIWANVSNTPFRYFKGASIRH